MASLINHFQSFQLLHWLHYVIAVLFALGLVGLLIRRNAIIVLMCIELMLNASNLFLVELSIRDGSTDGIIFAIFILTVAAAEVGVGLGIILNLYRLKKTVNLDIFNLLQG